MSEENQLASAVTAALWERGLLRWKLDQTQREIYDAFKASTASEFVVLCARQLGKTYTDCVIALETAFQNPGCRVNFITTTLKAAKDMAQPSFLQILEGCPEHLRPEFSQGENRWVFKNGALIVLVGANDEGGVARTRGPSVILNLIDEAGFLNALEALLTALRPQGIRTQGRLLLSSTPSTSPGHPFKDSCLNAQRNGAYIERDYWSPGLVSFEAKARFLEKTAQSRGETLEQFKTTTFYKREFLAQWVLDDDLAVLPEFAGVRAQIITESPRPPFYDLYVSVDPGYSDNTGILFALYDFRLAKLVIEHELLLKKSNSKATAQAIQGVLATHYDGITPYRMVIDNTGGMAAPDMWAYHKLRFIPAQKDDSEAAINAMRVEMGAGKILINPRCVCLIHQCATAERNPRTGDLARTVKDGHFDLIAALKYLVRSVSKHHNPYPTDFDWRPNTLQARPRPAPSLGDALLKGSIYEKRRK